MNKIIYVSNVHNDKYPTNTNVQFQSAIDESKLTYIPDIPLSIAVTSLVFKCEPEDVNKICAIKSSNLTSDLVVDSSQANSQILALFCLKSDQVQNDGITTIKFENPIFFSSTKEHIRFANFELFNYSDNSPLLTLDSYTFPTKIVCEIRPESMKTPPYSIILNSNDGISKRLFTDNKNTHFTTQLPKRLEFHPNQWLVCLKSLHLTNKLYNVNKNDYKLYVTYYEYDSIKADGRPLANGLYVSDEDLQEKIINIPPGYYPTIESFFTAINDQFVEFDIPLRVIQKQTGQKSVTIEWQNNDDLQGNLITYLNLRLDSITSKALGFASAAQIKEGSDFNFNFNKGKKTNNNVRSKSKITAFIKPAIFAKTPQEIFINCNIVNQMLVGKTSMRLLNFVSTTGKLDDGPIMSFPIIADDFARIEMKSIENIEITLTDSEGKLIEAVEDVANPTIINLFFVKV